MPNKSLPKKILNILSLVQEVQGEIPIIMHVFTNDQFIEAGNASLHISDLAIQRGYGIFDFFKVRNNVPLYVEDHLDRYFQSASIMHLPSPYTKDKLLSIVNDLIKKNNIPNSGIRMILTGGYSPDAYQPVNPNFIVMQNAIALDDSLSPKAISIITHEFVREIPEAKTINYTMGIWLQREIKKHYADDVLYHANGIVTEFPRCNFFIVTKDNILVTPEKNVLMGVTRKNILANASSMLQVKESSVTLQDIQNAKEAFLTSTTKRIQAVVKIDGHTIGDGKPGQWTTTLLNMLIAKEQNYVKNRL
jgi:branched-chain amino acid aminotransferase